MRVVFDGARLFGITRASTIVNPRSVCNDYKNGRIFEKCAPYAKKCLWGTPFENASIICNSYQVSIVEPSENAVAELKSAPVTLRFRLVTRVFLTIIWQRCAENDVISLRGGLVLSFAGFGAERFLHFLLHIWSLSANIFVEYAFLYNAYILVSQILYGARV